MATADELKQLGNAAVKAQQFDEAIMHYTEAIEMSPDNHVLFSNRSAAFASKKDYIAALKDAEKAIAIKPDWAKGYGRKGAALLGAGQPEEAQEAYKQGLAIDASNASLRQGIEACEAAIGANSVDPKAAEMYKVFADPQAIDKLKANPRTAGFFQDPGFQAKIERAQQSPETLKTELDERMIMCMLVLMGQEQVVDQMMAQSQDDSEARAAERSANNADVKESADAKKSADKKSSESSNAAAAGGEDAVEDGPAAEAAREKALGTAAYKKKDFETALAHYCKAFELEPTNMVFQLNIGAVHMERKDYDAVIAACDKAVEVGTENRADFKLIAKAHARIGKAHVQAGRMEEAVEHYDRALANHRNPSILDEKKKLDNALKEKARLAYIDPEKSLEAKGRGNALFKEGKFPEAIKEYTEAIKRNPEDSRVYSNRSACYTKLLEFELALKDAEECARLDPSFIKGHIRTGMALVSLKRKGDAEKAFKRAAEIDPNHPEVAQGLQMCSAYSYGKPGQSREERAKEALQDPEIQAILGDPVMQSMLQQMQQDPGALNEYMKNPEIADKIQRLFAAGIIGTSPAPR